MDRDRGSGTNLPPEPAGAEEIREAIGRAAETRSADDCERLATSAYLRQYERRSTGIAALEACRRGVFDRDRGLLPSDVAIEVTSVRKKDAAAFVTYRGGPYGGIKARLVLFRTKGGRWVLNRVTGYPFAPRKLMERALRAEIAKGSVPFGLQAARCAVRAHAGRSDPGFETLLLEAPAEKVYAPLAVCARGSVVAAAMRQVGATGLRLSPRTKACVRAPVAALPDQALLALALYPDANGAAALAAGCRGA